MGQLERARAGEMGTYVTVEQSEGARVEGDGDFLVSRPMTSGDGGGREVSLVLQRYRRRPRSPIKKRQRVDVPCSALVAQRGNGQRGTGAAACCWWLAQQFFRTTGGDESVKRG